MEKRHILGRTDLVFGSVKKQRIIKGQLTIITMELRTCTDKQSADFSATFEQYMKDKPDRRYQDNGLQSCGAGVEQFEKYFSQSKKYFGWHLVSVDSGPMHYVANSAFWFKKYLGGGDFGRYGNNWDAARCLQAAESCAHWGMLPNEEPGGLAVVFEDRMTRIAWGQTWKDIFEGILHERFPSLMEAFERDMIELFGEEAVREAQEHARELKKNKEAKG